MIIRIIFDWNDMDQGDIKEWERSLLEVFEAVSLLYWEYIYLSDKNFYSRNVLNRVQQKKMLGMDLPYMIYKCHHWIKK